MPLGERTESTRTDVVWVELRRLGHFPSPSWEEGGSYIRVCPGPGRSHGLVRDTLGSGGGVQVDPDRTFSSSGNVPHPLSERGSSGRLRNLVVEERPSPPVRTCVVGETKERRGGDKSVLPFVED